MKNEFEENIYSLIKEIQQLWVKVISLRKSLEF